MQYTPSRIGMPLFFCLQIEDTKRSPQLTVGRPPEYDSPGQCENLNLLSQKNMYFPESEGDIHGIIFGTATNQE